MYIYIVACHLPRGSKLRWREDIGEELTIINHKRLIHTLRNTQSNGGSRQYNERSSADSLFHKHPQSVTNMEVSQAFSGWSTVYIKCRIRYRWTNERTNEKLAVLSLCETIIKQPNKLLLLISLKQKTKKL